MKVTLKKPHTDAGIDHEAGSKIEVDETTAKFLADHDIIDLPAKAAAVGTTEGKTK